MLIDFSCFYWVAYVSHLLPLLTRPVLGPPTFLRQVLAHKSHCGTPAETGRQCDSAPLPGSAYTSGAFEVEDVTREIETWLAVPFFRSSPRVLSCRGPRVRFHRGGASIKLLHDRRVCRPDARERKHEKANTKDGM